MLLAVGAALVLIGGFVWAGLEGGFLGGIPASEREPSTGFRCNAFSAGAGGLGWTYATEKPVQRIWGDPNSSVLLATLSYARTRDEFDAEEVVAIDCNTGIELWRIAVSDVSDVEFVNDAAALARPNELKLIDIDSGRVRCTTDLTPADTNGTGPTYQTQTISYAVEEELILVAHLGSSASPIDAITTDCHKQWTQTLTYAQTPVLAHRAKAFVGHEDATQRAQVTALDLRTGDRLWQTTAPHGVDFGCIGCALRIDAQTNILMVEARGVVFGIDASEGDVLWSLGEGVGQPRWPLSLMVGVDPQIGVRAFVQLVEPQEFVEVSVDDGAVVRTVPFPVQPCCGFQSTLTGRGLVVLYATNDSDLMGTVTERGTVVGSGLVAMDPRDGDLVRHLEADGRDVIRWQADGDLGLAFRFGPDGGVSAFNLSMVLQDV